MRREEVAVALRVPLIADPVDAPQVRWGSSARDHLTEVVFTVREEESIGRVTFEELDAIRVARGEYLPFEQRDESYEGWEWVYVVENSRWLEERHRYEDDHYDWPLIESHDHYVFTFHDEFVEAIARGIWLDKPEAARPFSLPTTHPLRELPEETATERSESFGVGWELRTNPTPVDQLIEASRLCSQRLFQYNLILDGCNTEHGNRMGSNEARGDGLIVRHRVLQHDPDRGSRGRDDSHLPPTMGPACGGCGDSPTREGTYVT